MLSALAAVAQLAQDSTLIYFFLFFFFFLKKNPLSFMLQLASEEFVSHQNQFS